MSLESSSSWSSQRLSSVEKKFASPQILPEHVLDPWPEVIPGSLVLMLFLGPDEFSVFVFLDDVSKLVVGEGCQLLDSDDCVVLSFIIFTLLLSSSRFSLMS